MFQVPFGPTNRSEPFDEQVIEADVLERELIDEGVFKKLLRRGGRRLAIPAVEGLELLLDHKTPAQVIAMREEDRTSNIMRKRA